MQGSVRAVKVGHETIIPGSIPDEFPCPSLLRVVSYVTKSVYRVPIRNPRRHPAIPCLCALACSALSPLARLPPPPAGSSPSASPSLRRRLFSAEPGPRPSCPRRRLRRLRLPSPCPWPYPSFLLLVAVQDGYCWFAALVTSLTVMRPSAPEPSTWERSTPSSWAFCLAASVALGSCCPPPPAAS